MQCELTNNALYMYALMITQKVRYLLIINGFNEYINGNIYEVRQQI